MPTRNRTRIQWILPGVLTSAALVFLYRSIAQTNPDWMIHSTIQLSFSWTDFGANIIRFNTLLQHSYPSLPLLGALFIGGITWIFFQPKTIQERLAFWGTLILPLVVFGLSKISDGTENIYFGYGRFFLAIPFAWGFLWSNGNLQIPSSTQLLPKRWSFLLTNGIVKIPNKIKYSLFLSLTTLCISGYAYNFWEKTSIREFGKTYIPVMVYPMNQMKTDAEQLAKLCATEHIGAVLVLDHFVLECGSMGYAQMAKFPLGDQTNTIPIVRPKYERRHWLLHEIKEQNYIPKKVAVMDVWKDSTWGTQWPFKRSLADVRGRVFIFETGELPLNQFIENYLTSIPSVPFQEKH
jgi:hypothetical protein